MTTDDLMETIEELRATKHADLEPHLVQEVVTAQADFMGNPNEAYKRIAQAVETYLDRKEKTRC